MTTRIRAEPRNVSDDRDAMIRALEQCTGDSSCAGCAYAGRVSCWQELMEDTVAVLKATRPRVFTQEEAQNLKTGMRVCFEWRTTGRVDILTVKETDKNTVTLERNNYDMIARLIDHGKDWRLWTEIPDRTAQDRYPWEMPGQKEA